MLGRVGRTQPRTPRIPPKNRRIRARLHITVPTNPPEPRAPSHLCAHESARTMGTFISLCPRIRQNHGHPHITVPTNPAESWTPSYHCAHESARTMDTFISLCPRIRPIFGLSWRFPSQNRRFSGHSVPFPPFFVGFGRRARFSTPQTGARAWRSLLECAITLRDDPPAPHTECEVDIKERSARLAQPARWIVGAANVTAIPWDRAPYLARPHQTACTSDPHPGALGVGAGSASTSRCDCSKASSRWMACPR